MQHARRPPPAPQPPVVIPRWVLTAAYATFLVFGGISVYAGAPSLEETTSAAYVSTWGTAVLVMAIVSAIASVRERWFAVEAISTSLMASFLTAYLASVVVVTFEGGSVDVRRALFAWAVLMLTLAPAVRASGLVVRLIREVRIRRGRRA